MRKIIKDSEFIELITWLIVLVGGVVSMFVYAHATFQTQREADTTNDRLIRIESKIDSMLENEKIHWSRQQIKKDESR